MKPDLIRYSAIRRRLLRQDDANVLDKFDQEIASINRICKVHGYLADPVVAIDMTYKRLVVGCPDCSGPLVKERWENEGDHGLH